MGTLTRHTITDYLIGIVAEWILDEGVPPEELYLRPDQYDWAKECLPQDGDDLYFVVGEYRIKLQRDDEYAY